MTPVKAIAFDYGGCIGLDRIDPQIREKPVDPETAIALQALHDDLGLRLILASNTGPGESRWPALRKAGIDHLFHTAILSGAVGRAKPDPLFYRLVITAAECPPRQILFVGNDLSKDARAPAAAGMRAALIRPDGLWPGEVLPERAFLIRHVSDLPAVLEAG